MTVARLKKMIEKEFEGVDEAWLEGGAIRTGWYDVDALALDGTMNVIHKVNVAGSFDNIADARLYALHLLGKSLEEHGFGKFSKLYDLNRSDNNMTYYQRLHALETESPRENR